MWGFVSQFLAIHVWCGLFIWCCLSWRDLYESTKCCQISELIRADQDRVCSSAFSIGIYFRNTWNRGLGAHFDAVFFTGSGQNIEKQNIESQNIERKISKAKYRSRKISKSQNIEVAEYRVAKYRMRKISKLQNIVSHNIEWQNIDHAKYRRTKYRVQNIEW